MNFPEAICLSVLICSAADRDTGTKNLAGEGPRGYCSEILAVGIFIAYG
jgi:hypothetical protein